MKVNFSSLFCFLGCLLLLNGALQAQRPRYQPQVHEWGFQLYSAGLPQQQSFFDQSPLLNHNPLSGLRYKYHLDLRHALRFGAFYRANRYASTPLGNNPIYEARWRAGELSVGVERKLHLRKVQLFAALDGLFTYGGIRYDEEGSAPSRQSLATYGGRVSAGFRYFFSPYASLTVENGLYVMQSSVPEPPPGSDLLPPALMAGRETGFNLLSVYFSVHFKKMRKSCTCGKPGS